MGITISHCSKQRERDRRRREKSGSWHLTVKHAFLMSILVLHKPTLLQPLHRERKRNREKHRRECGKGVVENKIKWKVKG